MYYIKKNKLKRKFGIKSEINNDLLKILDYSDESFSYEYDEKYLERIKKLNKIKPSKKYKYYINLINYCEKYKEIISDYYTEYLADNLDKKIDYSEYIADNLDKK